MKRINLILTLLGFCFFPCLQAENDDVSSPYYFDKNGISRKVLENYLDKSITMVYFLTPDKPEGNRGYPYPEDDIRMVKNIGAKFLGRAIYRWGGESRLNDPEFWNTAQRLIKTAHEYDPEMILQACLFEVITTDVNSVPIPAWVFKDFGLPVEKRSFSYQAMLNDNGKLVNHWHENSSVPDISKPETQMWFYYLAGSYIDLGCEAFHIGQVELIGMNDPDRKHWANIIAKMREYAAKKARRHWIIMDAHVPFGGMVKDGISLLDFNSFPLRIQEIPEKPYEGKLEVNYLDGIYQKSKGCISPSGWKCEHLPFLVEFDNFGKNKETNVSTISLHFIWGWDEISWFSLQSEKYRNEWIKYAYNWIKETDPNGHLEMPGCRMITCPNESSGSYRANTQSENCPIGYSQEETIKEIFSQQKTNDEICLLVGSYSDGTTPGISVYDFNTQTGDFKYLSDIKNVVNPSYLVVSPDEKMVYSVNETSTGAVSAFRFDKQAATLRFLNSQTANGADPCFIHINKEKTFIVTANYSGGSLSVFPLNEDGTIEPVAQSIQMNATASPVSHIHTVAFFPDEKALLATDLGKDKIYKFNIQAQASKTFLTQDEGKTTDLKQGSGPRHIAFHPNGKYIYSINELAGTVTAFTQNNGQLSAIQYIDSDTTSGARKKSSADIHISSDGKFLYASNRGKADGIAIFSINPENGRLTKVGYQETGIHPRNFILSPNGKFLLCANRESNNIQVFAVNPETGLLQDTGKVMQASQPVCLKWVGK
jgi:6-phosphogluconolactonase (cycloisomerase 2 family)